MSGSTAIAPMWGIVRAVPVAALLITLPWLDGGRSATGQLVLVALAGLALLVWAARSSPVPPKPALMTAGVAAVLWTSVCWSANLDHSLRTLLMLSSVVAIFFTLAALDGREARNLVYFALGVSLLACAIDVAFEVMRVNEVPLQWLDEPLRGRISVRASGPFDNPNVLGAFAAFALPLMTGHAYATRGSWAAASALGAGAAVFCLGMTFSRAAWLGGAIGVTALMIPLFRQCAGAHLRMLPAVIAVISLAIWQLPAFVARSSTLPSPGQGTFAHRIFMWQTGQRMWRESPWIGVGIGGYEARFASARPRGVHERYALLTEPGSAHSDYVQWIAESGCVGLALVLGLAIRAIFWRRDLLRLDRAVAGANSPWAAGAMGCILAAVVGGAFQSNLRTPLCLLLVAVAVDAVCAERADGRRSAPRWSRVVGGIIALLMIAGNLVLFVSDRAVGAGMMFARGDQYTNAEASLHRAQELNPVDARPYVLLADIASSRDLRGSCSNELATAEDFYRQALALDPYAGAIDAKLADTLERRGRLHEAMDHWTNACAHDWYRASYHVQAARVATTLDREAQAREHLEVALALLPLWMQLIDQRQGRDSAAARLLRAVQDDAQVMLKQLGTSRGDPRGRPRVPG